MLLSTTRRDGRRRFPRLELALATPLRDLTMGHVLELVDISVGGCRTQSAVPIEPGSVHRFQTEVSGELVSLVGTVVHCRGVMDQRGPFTVGWQWQDDALTVRSVAKLIDHVTSVAAYVPEVSA